MKIFRSVILILLVASGMRFWQIANVPFSLNWDEATFAYNSYSLLLTGKDEYGKVMPLQFTSIGDYKCPLYIYLMTVPIKLFGLNNLAIRFTPALLGVLSVVLFYIITKLLMRDEAIALTGGLLLAIAPWHLQFTRAGADVAVSTFFLILGLALWFRGWRVWSAVMLGLTFYAYFGERVFTPLMVIILGYFFRRELQMNKARTMKIITAGLLTILPLLAVLSSTGHQNKILNTTILGYKIPNEVIQKLQKEDKTSVLYYLYHNPIATYGMGIWQRYLNHFSPSFLFATGPEDNRQRIIGMGMMYWSDLILIIAGIAAAGYFYKRNSNIKFVVLWLLIAPIPAAITRDFYHARRAFNLIYPLTIIMAMGWIFLWRKFKPGLILWLPVAVWSLGFYLCSYYIFTPRQTFLGSAGWQYGYKQLVEYVSPLKNNYDKVIVDTSYQGPYVYFLMYEKYPPAKYQPQAVLIRKDEASLGEGRGYDNYEFKSIYWPADRGAKHTLFAGPPERLPLKDIDPAKAKLVKTIYFPDGSEAWRVVETY